MANLTKDQLAAIADIKAKNAVLKQIEKLEKDKVALQAKIVRIDKKLGELADSLKPTAKQ